MHYSAISKALGDETRLAIVQMLSDGEKCGCKLLERFAITQPTLSHHMKTLVERGQVASILAERGGAAGLCGFSRNPDFKNGGVKP